MALIVHLSGRSLIEEDSDKMSTDYVWLCGVMWAQYDSRDAGLELVRALHSEDQDVASLACAILEKTVGAA
jgi:hypothetical protein